MSLLETLFIYKKKQSIEITKKRGKKAYNIWKARN